MLSKIKRKLLNSMRMMTGHAPSLRDPSVNLRERYPGHEFGRGTYGDLILKEWGEGATLRVGSFCSIAAGVQILLGGERRLDWVTTYPFSVLRPEVREYTGHPKTKGDVIIGHDVWIGTEAVILSGVTIGNGAVIGARALVSRSVAPYTIVVGNPASVVRLRFDESIVARLEAVKWWDWSDEIIHNAMSDLLSGNIETFLQRAEENQYSVGPSKSS